MKRSNLATYAMGIVIAAALTGCGSDGDSDGGNDDASTSAFADESAEDIRAAAEEAMSGLESVHLVGDINSGGSSITLDLSLSTAGNCEGDVSLDGGALQVLEVDGNGWFKADAAFWEAQAAEQADAIIAAAGDKWVVDTQGQFTSFCDLQGFLDGIMQPDGEDDFEKDGTDEVDGEEAVKLAGVDATAYIAADEPHYILMLEGTEEGEEGTVTFSEFDEEIDVEAPAADEVVNLDELG
jgi:hypothetical protein